VTSPIDTPAWKALAAHFVELRSLHLRSLFEADPERAARMTLRFEDLHADFSKHRATEETMGLLVQLAEERELGVWIERMFAGEAINVTEGRSVLHVALRNRANTPMRVDGRNVVPLVSAVLARMRTITERIRTGDLVGHTGEAFTDVVNIGIGGSDLGPALAYEALRPYAAPELAFRFVSNVDPADLDRALEGLDPAETLFVVVSKTMTTLETIANARRARAWAEAALESDGLESHFVGVATSADAGAAIGIPRERMLLFWDWVGGRTSLWSAVGFSVMAAIGDERFRELLAGAHAMDEHFATARLGGNLPAISGLLAVWYRNFGGLQTTAVVPYSHALRLLPSYLQQLWMESNGKGVTTAGEPVEADTGSVLWGGAGTNAQHATFQLMHQGTTLAPVDLIGFAQPAEGPAETHDLLAANLLAQAQALAFGRTVDELADAGAPEETIPHRVMPGNRPSSVILAERLDPATLGALLAFYEHSVFTQAAIWDVNPFDQWGVELGKELASRIAPELSRGWKHELLHDSSTNALIRRYRALRDGT
jgi:glucose-6-phosphate isomerase